jgi:hypothetical protein
MQTDLPVDKRLRFGQKSGGLFGRFGYPGVTSAVRHGGDSSRGEPHSRGLFAASVCVSVLSFAPVFLEAELMRSQLNLPPDAQARQQMLAQLHRGSNSASDKTKSQTSHGTKQPS